MEIVVASTEIVWSLLYITIKVKLMTNLSVNLNKVALLRNSLEI